MLRSAVFLSMTSSGVGPVVGWMAPGGMSPMGACSLACGSGSVGERPALWKESLRCWTRAWAEGSLVASQVESLFAFVVNHEGGLCKGSGVDVGLGVAEVLDFWLGEVEVVVC